jgi:DNA-binding NarL/FixJ family response regulator
MNDGRIIRVVIVDDEPDIRRLLEVQFALDSDFEVVGSAADGDQAVKLVRAVGPDAVVMDLLMPGVNGFQSIAALQQEFPDLAIVAYTGVAGDYVRGEMDRQGIEVVLKSGDLRPLTDAIRRSLKRDR